MEGRQAFTVKDGHDCISKTVKTGGEPYLAQESYFAKL
jgi:hypothetical protein